MSDALYSPDYRPRRRRSKPKPRRRRVQKFALPLTGHELQLTYWALRDLALPDARSSFVRGRLVRRLVRLGATPDQVDRPRKRAR